MGKKEIRLPTTPTGWAIHLSKIVKVVQEIHGLNRFPIRVADIARDFTRNVYPDAPITLVEGQGLSKNFEGALIPKPDGSGEWEFSTIQVSLPWAGSISRWGMS